MGEQRENNCCKHKRYVIMLCAKLCNQNTENPNKTYLNSPGSSHIIILCSLHLTEKSWMKLHVYNHLFTHVHK